MNLVALGIQQSLLAVTDLKGCSCRPNAGIDWTASHPLRRGSDMAGTTTGPVSREVLRAHGQAAVEESRMRARGDGSP